MNWFQSIWNNIVTSNDQEFKDRIEYLEFQANDLGLKNIELMRNQIDLDLTISELKANYNELKGKYLECKESIENPIVTPEDYTIPTDIIDTSQFAYLPSTLIYYYNSATKKIATKSVPVTVSKFYRMWTDEMYQFFRDSIKDCKTFDAKVIKLRDVIKSFVEYKYDLSGNGLNAGENWRFPIETFYGGIGDCEDTTSLWVTACHICDLPVDRIFNATGEYKSANGMTGHSFGLAKLDDGKWWVIETTSTRPKQLLLGNTEYFIQGTLNGLSNWKMSGKAKKEQF